MALVRLPGPAARRHADVESDGVGRYGLQQVKHVQPKQHRDVQLEARRPAGWICTSKRRHRCFQASTWSAITASKRTRARDRLARLQRRTPKWRDRATCTERGQLLQHQRLALLELDLELLPDVSRFLDDPARASTQLSVDERSRSRRLRDVNIRLAGAHQQVHAVLADDFACQRLQVLVVELAVELRARVDDAPVDRRAHRDGCRPVLGGQRQLQRAQVHVAPSRPGVAPASVLRRPWPSSKRDASATACRAADRAPGGTTGA